MEGPDPAILIELEAIERWLHAKAGGGGGTAMVGLMRWLRTLVFVAVGLRRGLIAEGNRQIADPDKPGMDLMPVGRLIGRALRFIRALRARVKVAAARLGLQPGRRATDDSQEPRLLKCLPVVRAARTRRPEPADVLAGIPAAAAMAQICADLQEAARLLGKTAAAKRIAAIAETLRAMLTDAVAAMIDAAAGPAAPRAVGASAGAAGVFGGVIAPDSG